MPWRDHSPMSSRLQFIQACLDRNERIVDICARFGISEKTGQKWLARVRAHGVLAGVAERSKCCVVLRREGGQGESCWGEANGPPTPDSEDSILGYLVPFSELKTRPRFCL